MLCLMPLEARDAPAVAAVGPELRVSLTTEGEVGRPAVGIDPDGDFVIAWQEYAGYEANFNVMARRYSADGVPLGGPFMVNTTTSGAQHTPAVGAIPGGGAVLIWGSTSVQDGSREGVFLRRFAADGTPTTGEIQVNVYTTHIQARPAVAVDAAGDFVVAWQSYGQDGSLYGIYARRFAAAGAAIGGEIAVNATTLGSQRDPAVGRSATGAFVIAWSGPDGDERGVFARRFTAAGVPTGDEFRVNGVTSGDQSRPAVAVDAAGNFTIVWHAPNGLVGRQYAADGTALGDEFQISPTASPEYRPAASADASGRVITVWSGPGDGDLDGGIYGRREPGEGANDPLFRANETTAGEQTEPSVSAAPGGSFVIAWRGRPPNAEAIYAQRFAAPPVPLADVVIDDGTAQRSTVRSLGLVFNTKVTLPAGAVALTGPAGPIALTIADAGGTLSQTKVRVTFGGPGVEYGSLADGRYTLTLTAGLIRNAKQEELDGDGDGTPGGDKVVSFHRLFGDFDGNARVDFLDFLQFRMRFGNPGDPAGGDFDGDGEVGFGDFLAFRTRFGVFLPGP